MVIQSLASNLTFIISIAFFTIIYNNVYFIIAMNKNFDFF